LRFETEIEPIEFSPSLKRTVGAEIVLGDIVVGDSAIAGETIKIIQNKSVSTHFIYVSLSNSIRITQ